MAKRRGNAPLFSMSRMVRSHIGTFCSSWRLEIMTFPGMTDAIDQGRRHHAGPQAVDARLGETFPQRANLKHRSSRWARSRAARGVAGPVGQERPGCGPSSNGLSRAARFAAHPGLQDGGGPVRSGRAGWPGNVDVPRGAARAVPVKQGRARDLGRTGSRPSRRRWVALGRSGARNRSGRVRR